MSTKRLTAYFFIALILAIIVNVIIIVTTKSSQIQAWKYMQNINYNGMPATPTNETVLQRFYFSSESIIRTVLLLIGFWIVLGLIDYFITKSKQNTTPTKEQPQADNKNNDDNDHPTIFIQ